MNRFSVAAVTAREILDSRGRPTVEAAVCTEGGVSASSAVPSGASTGAHEARELRDGDRRRYGGKGVLRAVRGVCGELGEALAGMDVRDQAALDRRMLRTDGTPDKSRLGANAILAVSQACARTAARALETPLYRYIGGLNGCVMPVPYMNVLNGGAHAGNSVDIQEFMLVPRCPGRFADAVRMCAEVYAALGRVLPGTGVGDEGGYAPELASDEDALRALAEAAELAGYQPGRDFTFALDAASSAWYDGETGRYRMPKRGLAFTREELTDFWAGLCGAYPVSSLEDGMAEDDWTGWRLLTERLGSRVQLVGDDLFVTDPARIDAGAKAGAANAVLIKPNQTGTLTGTMEAVRTAGKLGYACMMSHRSGETEDPFIADLAVALNCGQIKAGAPCRGERTAKYNRLLGIADELDARA